MAVSLQIAPGGNLSPMRQCRSWCTEGMRFRWNHGGRVPMTASVPYQARGYKASAYLVCSLTLFCSLSWPHEETQRTHPSASIARDQTSHDLDLGLAVSIIMRDASRLSEHSVYGTFIITPQTAQDRGFAKAQAFLKLNSLSRIQGFVECIAYLRIPY